MTPVAVKMEQQPDFSGEDFAALAEQFIQESWHLPQEGDQSWREQDARRIFSGQSKDEVNPIEDMQTEVVAETEGPDFQLPKALGILLPVSLATFVMVAAVGFSMPEILTTGFWSHAGPKRASDVAIAPISTANAAPFVARHELAPVKLRPSLIEDVRPMARPVYMADEVAVSPDRKIAQAAPSAPKAVAYRAATDAEERAPQKPHKKLSRLPPIGEAYFASHARMARKASSVFR